ncbi:MAG: TIGR04282 family arsenosugar biosynthesis glycosyltransferase, partial [Myxococcota bacterium]
MSRSRRGVLVVFAKAPEAGRVKTRLVPPFSPEQAAGLYACLLGDVLEESARAARALDLELVLAAEPPEAMAALAAAAPRGLRVVAQRGPDLASRMRWALAEAAAAGSAPILLRGSDSPTLDVELFRTALARLEAADLVICPDRDGGYSLVAMRRAHPGLFQHPMSTPSVLEDTLAEARRLGLRA